VCGVPRREALGVDEDEVRVALGVEPLADRPLPCPALGAVMLVEDDPIRVVLLGHLCEGVGRRFGPDEQVAAEFAVALAERAGALQEEGPLALAQPVEDGGVDDVDGDHGLVAGRRVEPHVVDGTEVASVPEQRHTVPTGGGD